MYPKERKSIAESEKIKIFCLFILLFFIFYYLLLIIKLTNYSTQEKYVQQASYKLAVFFKKVAILSHIW